MSDRKLFLLLYATLLIAFVFGIYLSFTRMTDPFLYVDIAFAKTISNSGELIFPEQGPFSGLSLAPGRQILMLQLINMTGISPDVFQFFPLGTIFLSITFFLLTYEILKSPFAASAVTLYLVFNLSHATALYSIFAYALGFPLMLGFFVVGKNILKDRNLFEFPILLLLFFALNFIHYTLTLWTIIFAVAGSLLIEIQRILRKKITHDMKPVFYLSLAFIVFFLIFNQTLYKSYIPNLAPETLDSAVQRFFSFFMFKSKLLTSPYAYQRSTEINYASSITLLFILVPIAVGYFLDLWSLFIKKSKKLIFNNDIPIIWAFLVLGLIDSFIYSLRGSISTKSLSMIFPIVTLYYWKMLRNKKIYLMMAIILLSTSLIKIPIFYNQAYFIRGNGADLVDLKTSLQWMEDHTDKKDYIILADLNLYGKYLSLSVDNGYTPVFQAYDENAYEIIIDGTGELSSIRSPDFIVIDKLSTQPTIGFIWNIFMPLSENLDRIRTNDLLSVDYEDESVLIVRFSNVEKVR